MEKKTLFYGIIIGVCILFVIALTPVVDSAIPPTDAFSKVYVNGQLIEADKYNDELYIITTGSLTTSINGDSVTIKLNEIACPVLQALKSIDSNGNLVCAVI